MKKKSLLYLLLSSLTFLLYLTSCEEKSKAPDIRNITGYVQKGPFISGSAITIYDLLDNLVSTGKSYNTQIIDNSGTFELKKILLSSNYISLRADGFYFNEVLGEQSVSQITLYALSDISDKTTINVNLLTHLEKSRVEYLMENGKTFAEAKSQAQQEILAIFNIEKGNMKSSEELNIAEEGSDNGVLLAVSVMLQGFRSEGELTELLSNISNDIREDGTLDSDLLGSAILNHSVNIDTTEIKNHLSVRYTSIGETSDIPAFGKYILNFIENTDFQVTGSLISYPETGSYGNNVLNKTSTEFLTGISNFNSFAAVIPKNGALKIKLTSLSNIENPGTEPDTAIIPEVPSLWYYFAGSRLNWGDSSFDMNLNTQTFTASGDDVSCDMKIFFDKGSFRIDYYEMNSILPTFTKTIFAR